MLASTVLAVPVVAFAITSSTFSWVWAVWFWAGMVPTAWREVRTRNASSTVRVDAGTVIIEYPALLRATVKLTRDDLHSIVPLWLRPTVPPELPWWRRMDARFTPLGVRPSVHVPVLGTPSAGLAPALGLVFKAHRRFPQARARWAFPAPILLRGTAVRGLLIAVDDLDEAQRPFVGWGKLSSLTPDAFEWLVPRSKATSPG